MPTPTFSSTSVDDTTIDHHCGHHRHMNIGHIFKRKFPVFMAVARTAGQYSVPATTVTVWPDCLISPVQFQHFAFGWTTNKSGLDVAKVTLSWQFWETGRNGVNVHFNLIMIIKRGFLQKSSMFHCIQPCVVCGAICYYYVVFYWYYYFVWLTLDKRTCRWLFFSNYQWLKS